MLFSFQTSSCRGAACNPPVGGALDQFGAIGAANLRMKTLERIETAIIIAAHIHLDAFRRTPLAIGKYDIMSTLHHFPPPFGRYASKVRRYRGCRFRWRGICAVRHDRSAARTAGWNMPVS
jgi:hypothetical protein